MRETLQVLAESVDSTLSDAACAGSVIPDLATIGPTGTVRSRAAVLMRAYVEQVLCQHPLVRAARVLSSGRLDGRAVAFVVLAEGSRGTDAVAAYARSKLPTYMVRRLGLRGLFVFLHHLFITESSPVFVLSVLLYFSLTVGAGACGAASA
jgi:hypothetical protein